MFLFDKILFHLNILVSLNSQICLLYENAIYKEIDIEYVSPIFKAL